MDSGRYFHSVELFHKFFSQSFKLCLILIAPPVGEVAVFIVSASLVIEAVDHFMADHHTYRTIIESVVGVDVEVWRLQYSGRETYFVDRWRIVCVDCLRGHEPLLFIDRLVKLGKIVTGEPS